MPNVLAMTLVGWVAGLLAPSCATPTASPVCMAGAKLDSGGQCLAQQAPEHHIPFRAGFKTTIMQGFHGYVSHKEDLAYSIDYGCPEGTPVTASRAGRVWDIREDSDKGCPNRSCVDDANYVVIDHGDGTYSEYYHLRQFGALVEPGEQVCRGQVIGLCGTTGFSSGPHLHFAITDTTRRTVPVRVAEAGEGGWGFVVPETEYTSQNRRQTTCSGTKFSKLPPQAFAQQGITLETGLPTVLTPPHLSTLIEGRYHGDHPNVAIHRKPIGDGEWTDECVSVDPDGQFAARLKWPARRFDPGAYWFMITGADTQCHSPGWAWSYRIRVQPSP